jgi:MFS family permease
MHIDIKINVNSIIRTLILSDMFLFFGVGLLTPIFAVFLMEGIDGTTIEMVGYAATFYWTARILSVPFISRFLDMTEGSRDEYYSMVIGTFVMATVPLLYIAASTPLHVYLIQIVNGVASAMAVPAWRITFTRYVNRRAVGAAWSLEDFGVGLATALSGTIGAYMAKLWGFNGLFIAVSLSGFASTMILATLYRNRKIMHLAHAHQPAQPMPADMPPLKADGVK